MLNVAVGATMAYSSEGAVRLLDGMGTYTVNLLEQYQRNPQIHAMPCVFKSIREACKAPKIHEGRYILEKNILVGNVLKPRFNCLETGFSLFHATDYHVPRLKNTPVLATVHDAIMFKHTDMVNPRFRRAKNFFMKRFMQYADHYITGSKAMIDDLVNYWGIPEEKISVIYNGVAESWFDRILDAERHQILQKMGLFKPFFLATGTLQPRKNFERIIAAFQHLPAPLQKEVELVIVGKIGTVSDKLLAVIKEAETRGNVKWLNYVDQTALKALYQSAQALVFPSLSEGFGIPILEAFASKTPVITSNLSSMPEVAGDAALLVDPYQVDDIMQAMQNILEDKSLRDDKIARGIERVSMFSWKRCADQTIKIYKQLVA